MKCGNCGDGSGWLAWYPRHLLEPGQPVRLEWVACADCNDDAAKPKPELCEGCGFTEPECLCPKRSYKRLAVARRSKPRI